MAIHWTDYPEQVETFGALLSVLETLERHEMESGFSGQDCQKESGRLTAYTVKFHNEQPQLHPRLDQMPGLERLLDQFEIDGYLTLTHTQVRELRRRAAKALSRDGASVNAMTFTEIADALNACAVSGGPMGASPPSESEGSEPVIYTLADILDFLRYKREVEQYESWSRSTFKHVMSVEEHVSRVHALALNAPVPSRLSAQVAYTLAAFRRLIKASLEVLRRELDEDALHYFVNEVADKHKLEPEAVLHSPTGEFLRLLDRSQKPKGSGAAPAGTGAPGAKPAPTAPSDTSANEKEGGRPILGEGPNATPQEKARRNVYELVRAAYKQGTGPAKLNKLFRDNKDFKDRVAQAGEALNEQLFRAAIAWIKEHPDQETQSENVS